MPWQPVVSAGVMAAFLALGALHPRVEQPVIGRHSVVNLVTGGLLFVLRIALVAGLALVSPAGLIELGALGGPWLQLLVAFLVLDFGRYWLHRLDHRVPLLWSFHRVHHSSEVLDATSGLRMHWVDLIQLTLLQVLIFGVIFDVGGAELWVVPTALTIGVVADALQHANVAMDMSKPFNRAWNQLFNNPHFHSWHHTRDGALKDGNYGNSLTVWDRLFGSEVSRPVPPEAFGLTEDQALDNSILGLQLLRRRT